MGSKWLNGCLVVWPSKLCLRGIQKFQNSKSTFIFSDFRIFPKMFLRQLDFDVLSVWQLFYVYYKGKTPFFFSFLTVALVVAYPANISTSDQRCFNVLDQRWNNVDTTLKMKQNPMSDFQRCRTLMQRQCPTLKQRRNNVTKRQNNVEQRWYNVDTTLFQPSVDVS